MSQPSHHQRGRSKLRRGEGELRWACILARPLPGESGAPSFQSGWGGNCPPSPTPLITGVTPIVTEVVTIASIHIAVQSDGSIQHCVVKHTWVLCKITSGLDSKTPVRYTDESWQCQSTNYWYIFHECTKAMPHIAKWVYQRRFRSQGLGLAIALSLSIIISGRHARYFVTANQVSVHLPLIGKSKIRGRGNVLGKLIQNSQFHSQKRTLHVKYFANAQSVSVQFPLLTNPN